MPRRGEVLRGLTPEQSRVLLEISLEARRCARESGDVPRDFTRTGKDHVEVGRILEVADGFVELLDGTFPPTRQGARGSWAPAKAGL
ncbi:hypothetical protein [Lentzea atacamensis]|uniref:hypothetical protein n=1 Tax=Lentzea atacamensis TaxID=531938 RepID=UPI0011B580B0|nr:hypothetical protein [Lentzea atacamensis]